MQNIEIKNMPLTLVQFWKWSGAVLTGGQAKEMVHAGMVRLNGKPCLAAGQKLQLNDVVSVEQQDYKLVLAD